MKPEQEAIEKSIKERAIHERKVEALIKTNDSIKAAIHQALVLSFTDDMPLHKMRGEIINLSTTVDSLLEVLEKTGLTPRQLEQFHEIRKEKLKKIVEGFNRRLRDINPNLHTEWIEYVSPELEDELIVEEKA